MPISRSLLDLSFGVSNKGALPPSSPRTAPSLRGALFPDPFLVHPPPKFLIVPVWREMPIIRTFLYISFSPQ